MTENSCPHLELIATCGGSVADQAMLEAIAWADRQTQQSLMACLIERGQPVGLRGLVTHYHLFADGAKKHLCLAVAKLGNGLRDAAIHDNVQTRLNVIEIIAQAEAGSMAYLLVQQLRGEDSRLSKAAAGTLFGLARRFASGAGLSRSPERQYIEGAVVEASACFHQHRRKGVVMAAVCFARRPSPLLHRHVIDPRGSAHQAAAEFITRGDHAIAARAMLPLGSYPSMTDAVMRGLSAPDSGKHLNLLIHDAHLLLHESVRAALRHVRRSHHLRPSLAEALDSRSMRLAARWVRELSLKPEQQIEEWSHLAASEQAATRLLALRTMTGMENESIDDLVASMCFDADATIARIALRHLLRRRWAGLERLMIRLVGSPHEDVRKLAEQQFGPIGFDRFWTRWPNLTTAMRSTAGRALMKIESQFLQKLAKRMTDRDPEQRFQAIMVARHLDQVSYFDQHLVKLSKDSDSRVASAAIKAMGVLHDSVAAVDAVQSALEHDDDRVRANAIEAMDSMHRLSMVSQKLVKIAAGRGNRSRATAIKALMELPLSQALPQLQRMLHDEDEHHRTSALWVVQKLGVLPMWHDVADLARHDDSQLVRRRALRMVREMAANQSRQKSAG